MQAVCTQLHDRPFAHTALHAHPIDACSRACVRIHVVCALPCSHVGLHADPTYAYRRTCVLKDAHAGLYAHNEMITKVRIQPYT